MRKIKVVYVFFIFLFSATGLFALQNDFCGINIHGYDGYSQNVVLNEESAQMFEDMGIKWIRLEFINDYTSSPKGVMHYDVYDKMIKTAKEHNLNILGLVTYQTYPWNEKSDWNDAAWQAKWLERVKEIVNRYKNEVSAWEIWNEPNIPDYVVDIDAYGTLLCNTYSAIKTINPDASVLMAGMANSGEDHNKPNPYIDDNNYIKEVYLSSSVKNYKETHGKYPFDYIAFHPYHIWGKCEEQDPYNYLMGDSYVGRVVRVLNQVGDTTTKFWLTELGWNTCPTASNTIDADHDENYNINTLGAYINHMFNICYKNSSCPGTYADRIEHIFFFQYQDWADQHFGILNESGQNKQAAIDEYSKWAKNNISNDKI